MRLRLLTVAVAAVSLLSLSGCVNPGGITTATCIDWVFFETPADAAEDADAVVLGSIVEAVGSTTYMGMSAATWTVAVDSWLEGTGEDEIVVTSLPRGCGDKDDTMASFQHVEDLVFFLRDDESGWQGVTPYQGVVPAGPNGTFPEVWPEGLGY